MNQTAIHPDEPVPFEFADDNKPVAGMLLHFGAELVDRPTLFATRFKNLWTPTSENP